MLAAVQLLLLGLVVAQVISKPVSWCFWCTVTAKITGVQTEVALTVWSRPEFGLWLVTTQKVALHLQPLKQAHIQLAEMFALDD